MRTTLTLDDDLIEQLREESARSGQSFKDTVNSALRRGLLASTARTESLPLHPGRDLGPLPGFSLDNIEDLLDQIEGDARR